jgi:hypothetical protein
MTTEMAPTESTEPVYNDIFIPEENYLAVHLMTICRPKFELH